MHSKKDKNFKLAKKLPILKNVQNNGFAELNEDLQDKIWDFELSIVYINEDTNPDFDPIDLFIRLNDKSYDIKDPSFEMWNSYAAPEIMERIKRLAKAYKGWFYYIMNDKRMKLEELLLSLTYLDYEAGQSGDIFKSIQIYQASTNPITFRVENPKIDHWLDTIDSDTQEDSPKLIKALQSIENVNLFIEKISSLVDQQSNDESKAKNFNQLINLKTKARNQRGFYILWFLLAQISQKRIKKDKEQIFTAIQHFVKTNQTVDINENNTVKERFQALVEEFWANWQ